jgi:hypothetical protein
MPDRWRKREVEALHLPGVAQQLGSTPDRVLVSVEDPAQNKFMICLVDPDTFTVSDTAIVDCRYSVIAGDTDYIYTSIDNGIGVYSRTDLCKVCSKGFMDSIVDMQTNPLISKIYIATSDAMYSYHMAGGQQERDVSDCATRQKRIPRGPANRRDKRKAV